MKKKIITILSTFILTFNLIAIGVCAEEITPTPTITPQDVFYISTETFIEQMWDVMWPTISVPFVIADKSFATAAQYYEWLNNLGEPEPWEQYPNVTVHSTHPPTGNIPLDVEQSTSVDVPIPVQNSILQFIQYQVAQNPVGYKECYIRSYNYLDPTNFNYYQVYANTKEVIQSCNGYAFLWVPNGLGNNTQHNMYICTIDKSLFEINFYGSTLSGLFTNVQLEHNWSTLTQIQTETNGVDWYMVRLGVGGRIGHGKTPSAAASDAGYSSGFGPSFSSIYNGTGPTQNKCVVMTSLDKDELIYCFDTINAYKHYNSGTPQPYYLTSEGLESGNWAVNGNGSINTGTMNNSGNYYSTVTNGVGANWTPEQIIALVNAVSKGSNTTTGSGSNENSGSSFGDTVKDIVGGIGEFFSGLLEGIADALLGEKNALGVREGGILGTLKDIFTSLIEVLTGGIIMDFLSAFMGWLPETILHLLTALFGVGVLFALVRFIRKAF